jgi:pimeloyl-ACP methyl ester carboxylesterase
MNMTLWLLVIIAFIFAPVGLSFLMEAARRPLKTPESLYWSKEIPIQYLTIDGIRLRYIKAGQGPALVLLHTLRTQLDIFQKVIPQLTGEFTVYAVDYPGHGFSDIPKRDYIPDFFISTIEKFLQELKIENATLAGISIGGSISLLVAARHNQRIKNVISINPYDYGNGMGIERGNFVAWLIFTLSRIPVLGETVMRFRNTMVEKIIFQGGVAYPDSLPKEYLQQVWDSGVRKGHYRAFINLIRNAHLWETASRDYAKINVPVLLVYGDKDWSHEDERQRTFNSVPGAKMEIVNNGGHFLSLDQPDALVRLIKQFAKTVS